MSSLFLSLFMSSIVSLFMSSIVSLFMSSIVSFFMSSFVCSSFPLSVGIFIVKKQRKNDSLRTNFAILNS